MSTAGKIKTTLVLRIGYDGLDKVIWRDVAVHKDMPLNELAYLILAAFDTMANHLYVIRSAGEEFSEGTWEDFKGFDARKTTLADLHLMKGDTLEMEYDIGCGQLFNIMVLGEKICEADCKVPVIMDGNGCGIIDDRSVLDIIYYIEQIDLVGKTVEPIYYKDRVEPWDYRNFDIDTINRTLKAEMAKLEMVYGAQI